MFESLQVELLCLCEWMDSLTVVESILHPLFRFRFRFHRKEATFLFFSSPLFSAFFLKSTLN